MRSVISAAVGGIKSLFVGLRWRLLSAYAIAFRTAFWEIFWGATVAGITFGLVTLFRAPTEREFLLYVLLVAVVAGYAVWKPLHLRLIPKLEFGPVRLTLTPTMDPNTHRLFIQVIVKCATQRALDSCTGQLLKVMELQGQDWVETAFDEVQDLLWSIADQRLAKLEPGVDRRLNIFSVENTNRQIAISTDRRLLRMALERSPSRVLKFDIRVAADGDCRPEFLSLKVSFGEQWDDVKAEVL